MEPTESTWTPVADLPGDVSSLANGDLASLAPTWRQRWEELRRSGELVPFIARLQREWAIETGIVEGLYGLNRPLTERLVREGIDPAVIVASGSTSNPELVSGMIDDHRVALDRVLELVRSERPVAAADLKELHALISLHEPAPDGEAVLKGAFRRNSADAVLDDGTIRVHAPAERIAEEIDRVLELHEKHEVHGVPPEVEAAWLHHALTEIAPFESGNGLVARAVASLPFLRLGWFPLIVRRDDVDRYAAAQERARAGELKALVDLFAFLQRRVLLETPGEVGDEVRRERVEQVIDAAREVFERRLDTTSADWPRAIDVATSLQRFAEERLRDTAQKMTRDLKPYGPDYRFEVDTEQNGGSRDYFFKWQIIENAKRLDYFANLDVFRAWTRLMMRTTRQDEVLLSFHTVGEAYEGKLVAAMAFTSRDRAQRGEGDVGGVTPLCDRLFEISFEDDPREAQQRFLPWLEAGLVKGLELWRESLA